MRYINLGEMFLRVAEKGGDRAAYMHKIDGTYQPVSFNEAKKIMSEIAGGLISLGVVRGDKVALLSENRLYWSLSDYAILALGAINVPIYPSLLPHQIEYVLKDSEAKVILCSTNDQHEKIKKVKQNCPHLKTIVVFDKDASTSEYLSFKSLLEKGSEYITGNPQYLENQVKQVKANDLATIIYTSGTTGEPKGAMLMHSNFLSNIEGSLEYISVGEEDLFLSFLPLCHVFERMAGHFLATYCGSGIAYAESIDTVAQNMGEVKPTVMTSVPRLYEKIYARILENVENGPAVKRKIFYWAIKVGKEYINNVMLKKKISPALQLRRNLAYKLVFSKLAERVGGRLRFFVSGGAPLAKEIAEFFGAAGLMVYEGYGLTETSPVIAVNAMDHFKFGTVGPILKNVEVKIAEDGEILTRGPHVMIGYYKKDADTKEAIDDDGWFRTGDIGFIDETGLLTITDRKKNILVTSGGKNIAPQPIENQLVMSKYIDQAMVVGDQKKFCSAVIVPNFDALGAEAKKKNLSFGNNDQLIKLPEIREIIRKEVDGVNQNLASYEMIKEFVLAAAAFTLENGEITPTLKIKRKIVIEKFKDEIDKIYQV